MPGPLQIDLAIRQAVPTTSSSTNGTSAKPSSKSLQSAAVAQPPAAVQQPPPPPHPPTTNTAPAAVPVTKSVAIAINGRNNGHNSHHPHSSSHHNHHSAAAADHQRRHKHKLSSFSEGSPLSNSLLNNGGGVLGGGGGAVGGGAVLTHQSRNNSLTFRPAKRQMATPDQTIAVVNASGRQTASLIRYCTAVGYKVRAQLRNSHGVIATEVCSNDAVETVFGDLYTRHPSPTSPTTSENGNGSSEKVDVSRSGPISGIGVNRDLIRRLFRGCQLAFINTTFYGDEVEIGMALADEAKRAGIAHYVYSSMPDHRAYNPLWPSLPLYSSKHRVEEYVRSIGLEATFVYAGIYNNNFTSLPYPLFCMELQADGSFVWQAPFHPDVPLPWLDCEHDFGTAVLTILKEGPRRWGAGRRVPIAFEMLTPREACRAFSRGVGRPVRYVRGPIELKVKIPEGYRQQLDMVQRLYSLGTDENPNAQPLYFGDPQLEAECPDVAMELWGGPRTLEQYAREEFIIEEQANGLRWMFEHHHRGEIGGDEVTQPDENEGSEYDTEEEEDGLVMSGPKRLEEKWLA